MFDWVFPRLHSVRRSTDQKLKQSEQRQLIFCCSNFFCVVFVMSQISFCLCNFNSVFLNYIPFVQSLFECFQKKSTHKLHRFYITEFETGFWRRWPTIWFQTELDPTRSCYQYWWYGEILIKTIFGKGFGIPFSTRGFLNLRCSPAAESRNLKWNGRKTFLETLPSTSELASSGFTHIFSNIFFCPPISFFSFWNSCNWKGIILTPKTYNLDLDLDLEFRISRAKTIVPVFLVHWF